MTASLSLRCVWLLTLNSFFLLFHLIGGWEVEAFHHHSHPPHHLTSRSGESGLPGVRLWATPHHHYDSRSDEQNLLISRRQVFLSSATTAITASSSILSLSLSPTPVYAASSTVARNSNDCVQVNEDVAQGVVIRPISASWSATSGLRQDESTTGAGFVAFDTSAYKAMRDDPSRTPIFQRAIMNRLNNDAATKRGGPSSQTVLDLGTGPFALLAILAAEAGAGRVYAIEANKQAAASARQTIQRAGWSDVITVLEGFSTEVTLPEPVDVCVAEIVGSIATEEGALATILDAHTRFLKQPNDPSSWIPNRIQTLAAPASYTLHTMFGPPGFDWDKLAGEPVRFNCRDQGLQLLSDPIIVEDISFADIAASVKYAKRPVDLSFTIDAERITNNQNAFLTNLRAAGGAVNRQEIEMLAHEAAHSLSGIALWPRLILLEDGDGGADGSKNNGIINARSFPSGGHQKSHWQTVLPIMATRPVGGLQGGEIVSVRATFAALPSSGKVNDPPHYQLMGSVASCHV